MENNHEDLRVIKTKRGLRTAFVQLLLEKDYDAISIQDIATEAETARITFYRHYKNKEELLVDCLKETSTELTERVNLLPGRSFEQGSLQIQVFFEHVQEKELLYRILFSNRGTQQVVSLLRTFFAKRIIQQMKERFPADQLAAPPEIIAYHIASALIGMAAWWLENDKPYPPEYMAQISFWLSAGGSLRACGVDAFPFPAPELPDNHTMNESILE